MFKRRGFVGTLVSLSLVVALAGCGSTRQPVQTIPPVATPPAPSASPAPAVKKETVRFTVPTGSTSGSYYNYYSAAAEVLRQHSHIELSVQTSGGAGANMDLLVAKQATIAPSSNDNVIAAVNGTGRYEGKAVSDLRQIVAMFGAPFYISVPVDSPIKSIWDLKGKRVSIGARGSGTLSNNLLIFDAIGLNPETDLVPEYTNPTETVDAWKDNRIEAWINSASSAPVPALIELAASKGGVRIFGLTAEEMKKVRAKYPFFSPYTLKKETYQGMTADLVTFSNWAFLNARADFPDDAAYTIVKTLSENVSELSAAYKAGRETSAEATGAAHVAPLHPGVEKYLTEKGIKF